MHSWRPLAQTQAPCEPSGGGGSKFSAFGLKNVTPKFRYPSIVLARLVPSTPSLRKTRSVARHLYVAGHPVLAPAAPDGANAGTEKSASPSVTFGVIRTLFSMS